MTNRSMSRADFERRVYRRKLVAHFRDPLVSQFGYSAVSTGGCPICQFQWFDSVVDLLDNLIENELAWTVLLDRSRALDELEALKHLAASIGCHGLTEEYRLSFNVIRGDAGIQWWGTIDDLLSGRTEFSQNLLRRYRRDESAGRAVTSAEITEFLKFIRCGRDFFETDSPEPFRVGPATALNS